jgi:hypothetical protein
MTTELDDTTNDTAAADKAENDAIDAFLGEHLDTTGGDDISTASGPGDVFSVSDIESMMDMDSDASEKGLASGESADQDQDSEQPSSSEADALANAKQALDRIGLDSSALQESLSKEAFFDAGRKAEAHHSKQTKEFERIRAESAKADEEGDADGDSASDGDDSNSHGDSAPNGQPEGALDVDTLLQPFTDVDPEASEALKGVLQPIIDQSAAAAQQADNANNLILGQTVAFARRDLQETIPALAQPDVWPKIDAKAQELAASGGKYLEPKTLEGRIKLALTDAAAMIAPAQSQSSASSSSPPPSGRTSDDSGERDALDVEIEGYLDS